MPESGETVATPSTDKAGEVYQIPKAELARILEENSIKTMQMVNEDREKLRADAKARETDPATRPSMAAVLEKGDPIADEKKGPGLEKKEIEELRAIRKKFPGGALPLSEEPRTDEIFKRVNQSSAPRGEIMDNFFVTRLAYATQQWAQGKAATISKYAPWEKAYYDWVDTTSKAQAESNGQDGGFLAPEEWANTYYGILRPSMILSRLPITFRPVGYRVSHFPVVTSDITVGYFAENASLSASQFQYSQRTATMRKQGAFIQTSNELIRDWLPAAENNLRVEGARAMARDRDKQVLVGNGQAGAPVGLANMTNVTTTSLAATPTFANIHSGILNVKNLNTSTNVPTGEANCSGIVGSVQLQHTMLQFKDSQNRPLLDMSSRYFNGGAVAAAAGGQGGAGDLGVPNYSGSNGTEAAISSSLFDGWLGVPRFVFSNLIAPGNSASVFYGDWQYLVVFQRQDVEIMVSNVAGTAFQNDQTWVRLISRWDVQCAHPEAFFIHSNAQP